MITDKELELLERLEGYSSDVYLCSEGKHTVGYGFNMDSKGAEGLWYKLGIGQEFREVKSGEVSITEENAKRLVNAQWLYAKEKAQHRTRVLGLQWSKFEECKQFVLTDIAYNTGSVSGWTKVFKSIGEELFRQARRKQRELDSRIAKIGYTFGKIESVEDAIAIGLIETKYVV